ncbi:MAG: hypothetical protein K0R24_364 [Gammaproteobacteria bacterium]|jgi:hypothetical protein|nr:hypothetical protein [Gammaproteobacteria bacterium]
MTEQVYHDPSSENKGDFPVSSKIFQLNDKLNIHLERLNALIRVANTHKKLAKCGQRTLRGYFWVIEDQMNQLSAVCDEVSTYL